MTNFLFLLNIKLDCGPCWFSFVPPIVEFNIFCTKKNCTDQLKNFCWTGRWETLISNKMAVEDKFLSGRTKDWKRQTEKKFEHESKKKMCNLPNEILLKILKEVPQFDLFTNVCILSKRFYELTNDSSIRIEVFFK